MAPAVVPRDPTLLRARAGDPAAFSELVRAHQGRIFRLALGMLHDRDEAEDVVQEAFLRAWRYLETFRSDAAFSTWVYRIAVNLCSDVRRHRLRVADGPAPDREDLELAATDPTPESTSDVAQQLQHVDAALARVSAKHRAILLLRAVEGLSYLELSRVLGIPKGTVMSRLFHARLSLQRACAALAEAAAPTAASHAGRGSEYEVGPWRRSSSNEAPAASCAGTSG